MKKLSGIIFAALFAIAMIHPAAAQEVLDVSSPEDVQVTVPGATVSIPLTLTHTAGTDIDNFGFTLHYPDNLLSFSQINTAGSLIASWANADGNEAVSGQVIIGAFDNFNDFNTGGLLMNVEFTVIDQTGVGTIFLNTFVDDLLGATNDQTTTLDNATPVELASFSAQVSAQAINLSWTTATESNNFGFDIERSVDAMSFSKIGFVKGNGNSLSLKKYEFADQNISAAVESYYYRLKQIDTDGAFDYSPTLQVALVKPETFKLGQNFPNPFNPETTISYELPASSQVTLTIFNMKGQVIRSLVSGQMSAGFHSVVWNGKNDLGQNAASGIYLYQLKTEGFSDIKRLTLLR